MFSSFDGIKPLEDALFFGDLHLKECILTPFLL
jgi:hypothetical protein